MDTKKICCVLPTIGDTKDSKRIEIFKKNNFDIIVAAFERKAFKSRVPNCKIKILGRISDGNYLLRIYKMFFSLKKLRSIIKNADLIYAISPDLAIFAFISSFGLSKPMVIDIADIRKIQVSNSFFGAIFRFLEKIVVNKCQLLVVTSEGFITDYYIKRLNANIEDYFLLENKVDYNIIIENSLLNESNNKIRIGYLGVLRDNWTIELLSRLICEYPQKFEVLVAGINQISEFNLDNLNRKIEGFNYIGPYKSPDELNDIYNKIDIMAIFYPEKDSSKNWYEAKKICRSNRFYESLYFNKPIIAFSFSQDGFYIEKLNIGMTFNNYDINTIAESLYKSLTINQINIWKNRIKQINPDSYMLTNEPNELGTKLVKIINTFNSKK